MADLTPEQSEALDIARQLIAAGVPVFTAPPCPAAHGGTCSRPGHGTGRQEYDLPPQWQKTIPTEVWLERWQPGHALAAVGGSAADFLDEDPRNGGTASVEELQAAGHMPRIFGIQSTPSGGFHYLISPLGEREANGFMPGLDYQGGTTDGQGRAFVWIAPTTKRSKVTGVVSPYRWEQPPDLDYLAEFGDGDDSTDGIRLRLAAARTRKERVVDDRQAREFTEPEARAFCDVTLQRLMRAEIGTIEEAANACAAQLSHFVPEFWSEEFAYAVLTAALGETAYDPQHPASGWTAEKFHAVLSGQEGRAPGDWKAVRRPETVEEVVTEPDAVDALIAEMLHPDQLADMPPPKPLIEGLLNLDSESWIIGAPGSKKSFVALDMAGHVARGMPWQGLDVTQGRVVFIVAEGAGGSGLRTRAWEKIHGAMDPQRDTVWVLPRPVQARTIEKWAVLVEACRRLRPALVVIDTQARVTVGLKENDATDMGIYVEAVRAIREATGACVLTIHHTGRQGGDARGSSAIDGAQSTELKIKPDVTDKLRARLVVDKQKDMIEQPDITLIFQSVDLGLDERGRQLTSLVLTRHDPDAYRQAERERRMELAEDWACNWAGVQEQILTVLVDQGGEIGLTKAEVRRNVSARWYSGKTTRSKEKDPHALHDSTFDTAWTKVREAQAASGDPIVSPSGGARFAVDSVARAAWKAEHE